MRAFVLNQAGGVESLQLKTIVKPRIKADEVLVKVVSIGINPVDVKARASTGVIDWIFGPGRPIILGWDIAGIVVAVGAAVTEFKIADAVFGMVNFLGQGNAYAEYVAAPAQHLALKPPQLTHAEAAAVSMAGSTAYQALIDVAKLKSGARVLIIGASGGVGHLAVQIAKHFGAYVIGLSSAKNRDVVLALGADEHLDYQQEDYFAQLTDVDIVLDCIQGDSLLDCMDVVRPQGIIISLPAADIPPAALEKAARRGVELKFMLVASRLETMLALADLLTTGSLKVHIYQEFPFESMDKAHLVVASNRVVGKVVVNL